MKKLFILGLVLSGIFLLKACGGGDATETAEAPYSDTQTAFDREHNARLSLDWDGTYTGVLPCADCEGIETTITLDSEGTFVKTWRYLGKDDDTAHTVEGTFQWNDAGSTITLEQLDAPNQLFVGENVLFHLDMDGNRIEGELADEYKLHKQLTY